MAFRRSLAAAAAGRTARQLMASWQWGLNQGPAWRSRARIAVWSLLAITAIGGAWRWLPPKANQVITTLLMTLVVAIVFMIHFADLLRLDHPHAARLVPRHAASLGHSALVLWSGCTALLGLGATAALASGDLSGAGLLPLACALAGALLLYLALALRWWWLWALPFAVPLLPALPPGVWQALRERALVPDALSANPWLACAAGLLAMGWVITTVPGSGGPSHRRAWLAREHLRRVVEASAMGAQPGWTCFGPWAERLSRPWQLVADAWLARTTRQGSVLERVDIVIMGSQHWLRQLAVAVPLLVAVGAVVVALVLMGVIATSRLLEHAHVGLGIGLFSMVLGLLAALRPALWLSRREQALLTLLPGLPRGAQLNRSLGALRARHYLLQWSLGAVPTAALAWAVQAPHLLALPAVALAALPTVWIDASRATRPSPWAAAWHYGAPLLLGLASMALLREQPAAWGPWLAGVAGLSLGFGAWRWRRLSRWPAALPAGRLA